jgi:hypothetical protein
MQPSDGGGPSVAAVEPQAGTRPRLLYCVSGAWTDAWFDDPVCWAEWCSAFLGWTPEQWWAFYGRWRSGSDGVRARLMEGGGLRFFDWGRVPGGSIRGSTRAAAAHIAADLADLPPETEVTVIGHSKGGHAVKHLLSEGRAAADGAWPSRVILVDAPLDWLRERVGRLMGQGIDPCRLTSGGDGVTCVTINNWLDPSGGRLRGARNYQTLVWQDYLVPYPPHGMKSFLARQVLADLGVLPGDDPAGRALRRAGEPGAAEGGSSRAGAGHGSGAVEAREDPVGLAGRGG